MLWGLIKFLEKALVLIFFIFSKLFWLVKKLLSKTVFAWMYRTYRLVDRKLESEEAGDRTFGDGGKARSEFWGFINKKYLFHVGIILLAVLVATNNLQAKNRTDVEGGATDSIVLYLISEEDGSEIIKEEGLPDTLNTPATYLGQDTAVSVLPQMKPKTREQQEAETQEQLATSEGSAAIMKPVIAETEATARKREGIVQYKVGEGDTISGIAYKFGVSAETVLWENGLSKYSLIRPEQTLDILPVTGLTHLIKSGENLTKIANTYKAEVEEIIKENKLADASDIKRGQKIIIPNGIKPAPVATSYSYSSSRTLLSRIISEPPAGMIADPNAGTGHRFPWGQCTWYVAQKRYVPWRGHAKQWIANASAMGYKIGVEPVPGSIIVTKESWWGHVGYVEKVSAETVTFSEMNHMGVGVLNYRTLKKTDGAIIGYIY